MCIPSCKTSQNVCSLWLQECEGFIERGITGSGAGFDASSMGRLGGRGPVPIHNPPAHQLKTAALKVSQSRASQLFALAFLLLTTLPIWLCLPVL